MPSTLLQSNRVRTKMVELLACLTDQIEDPANGIVRPCAINWVPGEVAIPEYQGNCQHSADPNQPQDCGLAWVRLMNLYSAQAPGVPVTTNGQCSTSGLGFDVNMGITRCWKIGDDPKLTTTIEETFDFSVAAIADALVLRKALKCCVDSKSYSLATYVPIGPGGGVIGGSLTTSVMIP